MAFSTTARITCGPTHGRQPVCSVVRAAPVRSAHRQLARQSDTFSKITLRTTSSKLLRWNVNKPGRGGRLFVEAAHSAVPKAAGLFNPANDKVSCELHAYGLHQHLLPPRLVLYFLMPRSECIWCCNGTHS